MGTLKFATASFNSCIKHMYFQLWDLKWKQNCRALKARLSILDHEKSHNFFWTLNKRGTRKVTPIPPKALSGPFLSFFISSSWFLRLWLWLYWLAPNLEGRRRAFVRIREKLIVWKIYPRKMRQRLESWLKLNNSKLFAVCW